MKKIGIVGKTGKTEPAEMIKEFLPWLLEQGCEVYIDSETASIAGMQGYPRSEIPDAGRRDYRAGWRRNNDQRGEACGR